MEIVRALFLSFVFGGLVCMVCQLIMDKFKLLPVHITCGLVVVGGILDLFDIYDNLLKLTGCGASILISNFGHTLTHSGAVNLEGGYFNIFKDSLIMSASGITFAICLSFFLAILFKPRS